ncbi:FAD-dependent oxidoreductase [Actinophytocola sp.]|uniref:FAD-dependent oxidoreductase n=1 Tax=Actinophytocola sp. TaxID=1872138 RepID=UPI002D243429|nr:FAD-dependent oxidoreductase [Actinophytocola sp.]HYQ63341.1 FAD-dependent oxidoreductase [Actinophytocola sp.]
MKIIIIGAGLAGVASAYALSKDGHEVTVLEQAGELRKGGYGVILWPNATGILGDLGIPHQKLPGHLLDRVDIQSEFGDPLVRVELDRIAEKFDSPNIVIRRSVLVEHIAAELPPGTLRFNALASKFAEPVGSNDPIQVKLADGTVLEADVLIGADGHRSVLRTHLFGESVASYTGWATWHGTTRLDVPLTNSHRVQTLAGKNGLCVMHPLGESMLYWAFETPWANGDVAPPPAPGTERTDSPVANLKSRFAGYASPLPELLDSITDADVSVFPHILHKVPRWWGRGRVTLAGDAVHAVPPRTGMGANQALEDAWMLRNELSRPGDPASLLRAYERKRRRRVRMLFAYAALTGKQGQSMPGLFRSRDGVSLTGFQAFQIKAFSNYLNR